MLPSPAFTLSLKLKAKAFVYIPLKPRLYQLCPLFRLNKNNFKSIIKAERRPTQWLVLFRFSGKSLLASLKQRTDKFETQ